MYLTVNIVVDRASVMIPTRIPHHRWTTFSETKGTTAIQQSACSASATISVAQSKLDDAQRQVNMLNAQVVAQTVVIQAERSKARQALNDAQANITRIQNTIHYNQQKGDQLNSDMDALKNEIRHNPFLVIPNGAKIVGKGTEIGGLTTAIESECLALVAVAKTLDLCKSVVAVMPIETDPRISSLSVALTTATAALQAAQAFLESTKQADGKRAGVASWLTQHGSDQFLVVTAASFAGRLAQLSSGSMSMNRDLTLMDRPYHIN